MVGAGAGSLRLAAAAAAALLLPVSVKALDNGLARTPPLGWNAGNCYGTSVSSKDLRATADFFVSSGLREAGYTFVSSDDGWQAGRDPATGRVLANAVNFPEGMAALAAYIHSKGLKFGLYSAASSVVCSGRVGSLYYEELDAQTYAEWGVDYIKYDSALGAHTCLSAGLHCMHVRAPRAPSTRASSSRVHRLHRCADCGEYGLGDARFMAFADAINATGAAIVISTEPFSLQPTPSHRDFAHLWRTTNDINANFNTILDRADTNDKWASLAAPGGWNDPVRVYLSAHARHVSRSLCRRRRSFRRRPSPPRTSHHFRTSFCSTGHA